MIGSEEDSTEIITGQKNRHHNVATALTTEVLPHLSLKTISIGSPKNGIRENIRIYSLIIDIYLSLRTLFEE